MPSRGQLLFPFISSLLPPSLPPDFQKNFELYSNNKQQQQQSDYPTHSRKIKVDHEIIRTSQRPEHVTIASHNTTGANSTHSTHPDTASNHSTPDIPHKTREHRGHAHHYERVRNKHTYEDIIDMEEDSTPPPAYSDIFPENGGSLENSIKRSNRWSPGLEKHSKGKSKPDKSHPQARALPRGKSDNDILATATREEKREQLSKKKSLSSRKKHSTGNILPGGLQGEEAARMVNRYFPVTEVPVVDKNKEPPMMETPTVVSPK